MKPTDDLAACLVAAQAEAERLYGAGPAARWQPARKSWRLGLAACAIATAAGLAGVWSAPSTIEAPAVVAGTASPPPAAAPAADIAPPSEPAVLVAQAATAPSDATPPTWQPADPDDWALDPRPIAVPMAATASTTPLRLHNTPVSAEEAESAAADENEPDTEQGGGHEE